MCIRDRGGTDVAVATGPESARSVSVFSVVVDPHPMVIITISARMTNLNNIYVSSLVILPTAHDLVIVGSIADLLQCSDFVYNVGLKEFCYGPESTEIRRGGMTAFRGTEAESGRGHGNDTKLALRTVLG